jgi:hypothetical protein
MGIKACVVVVTRGRRRLKRTRRRMMIANLGLAGLGLE